MFYNHLSYGSYIFDYQIGVCRDKALPCPNLQRRHHHPTGLYRFCLYSVLCTLNAALSFMAAMAAADPFSHRQNVLNRQHTCLLLGTQYPARVFLSVVSSPTTPTMTTKNSRFVFAFFVALSEAISPQWARIAKFAHSCGESIFSFLNEFTDLRENHLHNTFLFSALHFELCTLHDAL